MHEDRPTADMDGMCDSPNDSVKRTVYLTCVLSRVFCQHVCTHVDSDRRHSHV